MSESDDYTIRSLRGPDDPLLGALRQYRLNLSDEFVFAYDKAETEQCVAALKEENARLMRLHADTCVRAGDEIAALKARVAELEDKVEFHGIPIPGGASQ